MMLSLAACGGKKDETQTEVSATNVEVYTAKTNTLENTVSYTGEIKAISDTSITSKVTAKIKSVHAKEGDFVTYGTVLAELDSTDIQNAYKSALAAYNSAQASYNMVVNSSTRQASANANNSLVSAQLAYEQASDNYKREKELFDKDTTITVAKNTLNDANAALKRTEELFDIGAASQLELDMAKNNAQNAQAAFDNTASQRQASLQNAENAMKNAENALRTAKENIGLTSISNSSSIESAKAALQSASTAYETAKSNLAETVIKANSTGYVATANATVGQFASAGSPLFTMKDVSSVVAQIEVTESVIPYIKEGTRATVDITSAKLNDIAGTVTLVNPTKSEKTGMYTVQVTIDNADKKINTGMFANVELVTEVADAAITIPSQALMQEDDEYFVYVADPTGKTASKVRVTIGIETEESTEILSGISSGDEVVISGQDYLSEKNNAIKIVKKDGKSINTQTSAENKKAKKADK